MPKKREPGWAGVIGHPISHSLSPEIFAFLAARLDFPLGYRKLAVAPGDLAVFVKTMRRIPLLIGWNVTIPHKQAILPMLDRLSPEAAAIGAVNVVKVTSGKLRGYNTDIQGVRETLREQKIQLRGKHAVIFGAGGAARALGYALGQEGVRRIWIANRDRNRARKAAADLGRSFPRVEFRATGLPEVARITEPIALYANATPLGMPGFSRKSLLPSRPTPGALAFELVYRPERTVFLTMAKKSGLRTVGGLDMLIWQAIAAWEIWFEKAPHRDRLKSELQKKLRKELA